MALPCVSKHPSEIRAVVINWAADIGTATITDSEFTIETFSGDSAPLTLDSQVEEDRKITPLFAGGSSGKTYQVENKVTLSDGQELVYEFDIEVIDQ